MKLLLLFVPFVAVLASCRHEPRLPYSPRTRVPVFDASFDAPTSLATTRFQLEPLAPQHAEIDFAALMGSREHLQSSLRWGDWPREDFTVEENREDLQRHWDEFQRHEAYAYTVLSPDGECIGCVYLVPVPGGAVDDAMLAYWVVESELASSLDAELLRTLVDWFRDRWNLANLILPVHEGYARGLDVADDAGFAPIAETGFEYEVPEHVVFVRTFVPLDL